MCVKRVESVGEHAAAEFLQNCDNDNNVIFNHDPDLKQTKMFKSSKKGE